MEESTHVIQNLTYIFAFVKKKKGSEGHFGPVVHVSPWAAREMKGQRVKSKQSRHNQKGR